MKAAIEKLEYHIESETKAMKEVIAEINELPELFYGAEQIENYKAVVMAYKQRIKEYKQALVVLKAQ